MIDLSNFEFRQIYLRAGRHRRVVQIRMPYKESEVVKLYHSIGEVCNMFNVAPSLIRFWEMEFDIIQPKKNRNGKRQFTNDDIKNIRTIYHLVKERGFTLQGAKEALKNNANALKNKADMIDSLKKIQTFLVDLKRKVK